MSSNWGWYMMTVALGCVKRLGQVSFGVSASAAQAATPAKVISKLRATSMARILRTDIFWFFMGNCLFFENYRIRETLR
jgi:hypothetical protein